MADRNDLNRFQELPGMKQALQATKGEKRKPTEADAPPPTTFPMTPAARAALQVRREQSR